MYDTQQYINPIHNGIILIFFLYDTRQVDVSNGD